jgi:Protein of unknown function (DUF3575)
MRHTPPGNRLLHGLLFCLMIGSGMAHAQFRSVAKLNPLSLALGTLNVQGEYLLNERLSLSLGCYVGAHTFEPDALPGGKLRDRWIALTPELRFYPGFSDAPAPQGFYAGPFLRFRRVRATWLGEAYDPDLFGMRVVHVTQVLPTLGLGGVFGYQFIVQDRLSIDVYGGPYFSVGRPRNAVRCATCDGDEEPLPPGRMDFSGMEFRFGASVGLPF